ncbi:MAG: hypothetical protein O2800_01020 [Planctomycetota bacterium]|nr:hypothetical protein [Planctomycetota bacterium]
MSSAPTPLLKDDAPESAEGTPCHDPLIGLEPVIRLLSNLTTWVDANRSLIREANAILTARAAQLLSEDAVVFPPAIIEVTTTLERIAESVEPATEVQLDESVLLAEMSSLIAKNSGFIESNRATPDHIRAPKSDHGSEFLNTLSAQFQSAQSMCRLISRALRIERARRGGEADREALLRMQPDVEAALLKERLTPWPFRDSIRSVDDGSLLFAEESYRGLSIACGELCNLIEDKRADLLLGAKHSQRKLPLLEYLAQRTATLASAAFHASKVCGAEACVAQTAAHKALRALVREDAFSIPLKRHMVLDDPANLSDVQSAIDALEIVAARRTTFHAEAEAAVVERARRRKHKSVVDDGIAPQRFLCVADALDAAEREFFSDDGTTVVVTASARGSAEDSPFVRPDEVFAFFQALDRVSRAWATNVLQRSFHVAMREYGFDDQPISDTAKTRFRRHYIIPWQGERVLMMNHFTLGSHSANTCLCIHWYRDEDRRRIVVGHCGIHLPNTRS